MTASRCAGSWASTWAASRCRSRPPLCKFRHLLERHEPGSALFQRVREHLERHGLKLSAGTIVDAAIICAPSSTMNAAKARNRTKSQVRAKVEHGFGVIKRVFGFVKVRYRGLDKNANRLFVTCALANLLFLVRHRLPRLRGA